MKKTIFRLTLLASLLIFPTLTITQNVSASQSDITCLAKAIYFEARGEPRSGQLAVAKVVINRTKSNKFPNTICKVVYQKGQFSWTASKYKIKDWDSFNEALAISRKALTSNILPNFNALYFRSTKGKFNRRLVATIGNHHFYV